MIRHSVIFWIQNIGQIKIKDGTNFKSFREEKFPLDSRYPMIELLFADCNCQSLTKKIPLRCQKFPHSSQIFSQISVGFANFVDMGTHVMHTNSMHGMSITMIFCGQTIPIFTQN